MLLQITANQSFMDGNGPTYLVLGLYLGIAFLAGILARFAAKTLFGIKTGVLGAFLLTILGGVLGISMHFYANHYFILSRDEKGETLLGMFGMFSLFTLANMIALPLLIYSIKSKNLKIKQLEEDLRKKG
jgi:hypothetical protein